MTASSPASVCHVMTTRLLHYHRQDHGASSMRRRAQQILERRPMRHVVPRRLYQNTGMFLGTLPGIIVMGNQVPLKVKQAKAKR